MKTGITDISQRQAAKIAGFGLLFMFISGIFASASEATVVFDAVHDSIGTLRKNIAGDIMMLVFDVVAAMGLYVFLRPINNSISILAAWFRLLHVAIYGISILYLLFALDLLNGIDVLPELVTDQLHTQLMPFLKGHEYGFRIGLVFFGFHFLVLGYLVNKSDYIPKILGILLVVVAIGYFTNSFASFLMPNYGEYQTIIQRIAFIPAIIAELSLCLWLLFKGGKMATNVTDSDNNKE
jgi:hypothetical protein